jgi:dihydropyrimidinase
MQLDSVVQGGLVITAAGASATDIGIRDGRVVALGSGLVAPKVIDVSGLTLIPGPLDVHTHFANEVAGTISLDDYQTGSRAAALGGVTTFVNFVFQRPGQSLVDAVRSEKTKAAGRAHVDYGLQVVITDPRALDLRGELQGLVTEGVTSVKVFMAGEGLALDPQGLLAVLDAAAQSGVMVSVHAEDGPLIEHLTSVSLEAGNRSIKCLPTVRPPEAEALASGLITTYASMTGCRLYLVHVSCRYALEAIRAARRPEADVYLETRPAYLFLTQDRYELPGTLGNDFVCWPPLRSLADQEALWEALRAGEIHTYATDHATWSPEHKTDPSLGFHEVVPGMSGVQTSIGLLYGEGALKGRISMNRLVQVTCTNPSRLFGLWPRKGDLQVGSDADLVALDPHRMVRIDHQDMASRSDFEPYAGREVTGWPALTMVRGQVVMRDGVMLDGDPHGEFQARRPSEQL